MLSFHNMTQPDVQDQKPLPTALSGTTNASAPLPILPNAGTSSRNLVVPRAPFSPLPVPSAPSAPSTSSVTSSTASDHPLLSMSNILAETLSHANRSQAELGMANESIASTCGRLYEANITYICKEANTALQDSLYKLREETQTAFDDAKNLEKRWRDLEKEQREVYQVCFILVKYQPSHSGLYFPSASLRNSST